MTLHPEVLRPPERRVLQRLGPLAADRDFYLAGGTGLALQLGHRRSADLDWFAQRLDSPQQLADSLRDRAMEIQVLRAEEGTLHLRIAGMAVSFLAYRYPLLSPLVPAPDFGARLASLDDIATMKLSAITQRAARKDFVDLYALAISHRPLEELIGLYRQRFGIHDSLTVLRALSYFDDVETDPMPRMLWHVNWRTIRSSIRVWVQAMAP